MARKQRKLKFWTAKRLIELRVAARKSTIEQLAAKFQRSPRDIEQAIRYELNKRKLSLGTRKEIINGKTIRITCFAAEYADGSRIVRSIW